MKKIKELYLFFRLPYLTIIFFILIFFIFVTLCFFEAKKISQYSLTSWTKDHNADCAIVLTGSMGRVREGFDLLERKQIKKLIVAGVHPYANLRQIFPRWPYYENLRKKDIFLEKRSKTTYGNAQQSLPLVETIRCRDIILITSRLHMYRAKKTFQSVFSSNYLFYFRTVSSGSYEFGFWELFVEVIKSLFYSLLFY